MATKRAKRPAFVAGEAWENGLAIVVAGVNALADERGFPRVRIERLKRPRKGSTLDDCLRQIAKALAVVPGERFLPTNGGPIYPWIIGENITVGSDDQLREALRRLRECCQTERAWTQFVVEPIRALVKATRAEFERLVSSPRKGRAGRPADVERSERLRVLTDDEGMALTEAARELGYNSDQAASIARKKARERHGKT